MNILFTVCARAGSKGVKNKNIREFNGIPIVFYTLAAYMSFWKNNSKNYNDIVLAVNTDSIELIDQIKKSNLNFYHITRKDHLAGDFVSKLEVIKDTYKEVEALDAKGKPYFDIIVDLDITSPLRQDMDIKGVVDTLNKNHWADLAFSVTQSRRLPFFNMVKEKEDGSYGQIIESDFVSRQQAPKCYDMNASIYAYKREFIMKADSVKVFDGKAAIYEMIDTAILDIDNESDFELMEIIAASFYEKLSSMKSIKELAAYLSKGKEENWDVFID